MKNRLAPAPRLGSTNGEPRWFVDEYFLDMGNWRKYCHYSFGSEREAKAFIRNAQ